MKINYSTLMFTFFFLITSQNSLGETLPVSMPDNKSKDSTFLGYSAKDKLPSIINKIGANYFPYFEVGGTRFFGSGGVNTAASYDFFMPVWQTDGKLLFVDARIYDRSGKSFEGNLHFGYRQLFLDKQQMVGVYVAFDRKKTNSDNCFSQLTFGFEYWFKKLFIGGNFYQPIGKNTRPTEKISSYDREILQYVHDGVYKNIWTVTNRFYEKATPGIDMELGYELTKEFIVYLGGYYFKANNVETILGPKLSLNYNLTSSNNKNFLGLFDKVSFGVGVQHDKVRKTLGCLNASFRIGLWPSKQSQLDGVGRHIVDLVRRDVDIVIGSYPAEESYSKENYFIPYALFYKSNNLNAQDIGINEVTRVDNTARKNDSYEDVPKVETNKIDQTNVASNIDTALIPYSSKPKYPTNEQEYSYPMYHNKGEQEQLFEMVVKQQEQQVVLPSNPSAALVVQNPVDFNTYSRVLDNLEVAPVKVGQANATNNITTNHEQTSNISTALILYSSKPKYPTNEQEYSYPIYHNKGEQEQLFEMVVKQQVVLPLDPNTALSSLYPQKVEVSNYITNERNGAVGANNVTMEKMIHQIEDEAKIIEDNDNVSLATDLDIYRQPSSVGDIKEGSEASNYPYVVTAVVGGVAATTLAMLKPFYNIGKIGLKGLQQVYKYVHKGIGSLGNKPGHTTAPKQGGHNVGGDGISYGGNVFGSGMLPVVKPPSLSLQDIIGSISSEAQEIVETVAVRRNIPGESHEQLPVTRTQQVLPEVIAASRYFRLELNGLTMLRLRERFRDIALHGDGAMAVGQHPDLGGNTADFQNALNHYCTLQAHLIQVGRVSPTVAETKKIENLASARLQLEFPGELRQGQPGPINNMPRLQILRQLPITEHERRVLQKQEEAKKYDGEYERQERLAVNIVPARPILHQEAEGAVPIVMVKKEDEEGSSAGKRKPAADSYLKGEGSTSTPEIGKRKIRRSSTPGYLSPRQTTPEQQHNLDKRRTRVQLSLASRRARQEAIREKQEEHRIYAQRIKMEQQKEVSSQKLSDSPVQEETDAQKRVREARDRDREAQAHIGNVREDFIAESRAEEEAWKKAREKERNVLELKQKEEFMKLRMTRGAQAVEENMAIILRYVTPEDHRAARDIILDVARAFGPDFYRRLLEALEPAAPGAPAAIVNLGRLQSLIQNMQYPKGKRR